MKVEEIIKFLHGLGLNEYEAKTYATLSMGGKMKAGNISKQSGVPQSKVYWVLDSLVEKQMVAVAEGKPKEYVAVPSDVALKRLVEEKERAVAAVKTGLKEVSSHLKSSNEGETMTGMWTVRGRNWVEFFNKATEMIGRSRKYVYGVTRDYSRSAGLAEMVKSAAKKGIKIRVLGMSQVTPENFLKAKWYLERGVELRTIDTNLHPRIILVDGKEVLLRLDHDHAKKDGFPFSSVWSEDPSLVKVFDTYVKNLWENAKGIDWKGVEERFRERTL